VLKRTLAYWLLAITLFAGSAPARPLSNPGFPNRPKLVVVLVIDQFRYDYLLRFRPFFGKGGFNLLLDGGAVFTDCRYDCATTTTGPAHAALLTGAYPNLHGIIENEWYDPLQHRQVYCVEDLSTRTVASRQGSSATPGFSPRNLVGSTLGDELRAATDFRSKVISISLKDRAAVLMGGHSPAAAYWYDPGAGRFVTSTYYEPALPAWVEEFNQSSPAQPFCGEKWQALPETPGAAGKVFSYFEPSAGEPCPDPKFLGWLHNTPYMNQIELAFASRAVRNERLGQGTETDLLAVSLSENDQIGHEFGPYSPQVADVTLRTDRYLASFFADLDKLVGLENVWIAFSADHGVAPNPAFIREHQLGLGNAQAATSQPEVAAAFTRSQFLNGNLPNSPLARMAANSFYPKRSGDVFLVLMPYAVPVSGMTGTSHGTPWSYDTQVPLVLWGNVFKPGYYATACQPIDMAATLAAALGLTQPSGAQGKPLVQALK
jgi:hypothetical protein